MRRTAVLLLVLIVAGGVAAAQRSGTAGLPRGGAEIPLPRVSHTCPHHPDVIESRPGTCPLCRMALVPVRLDSAWMCPVHSAVIETGSGACPICRRALIPVTVSLTWACRGEAAEHLDPGRCADGSPRVARRTLRPHGNHNPRHGGLFFMAPDNWHHLEGTYPSSRVFRLYLYDDFGRPLSADRLREVRARVVTRETYDAATRQTRELSAFALRPAGNGAYLEARVDAAAVPAEMTAKVRFTPDAPEYRFDFTFAAMTREPVVPAPPRTASRPPAAAAPAPVPAAPARPASAPAGNGAASAPSAPAATSVGAAAAAVPSPDTSPASDGAAPPGVDPALVPLPIPETMTGILEQLTMRRQHVGDLIARGDFAAVWVPAFQAKDLAVALEPHLAHLDAAAREAAEPALRDVVRLSWLLDAVGDVGSRQQADAAYSAFSAAIAEVVRAFGAAP